MTQHINLYAPHLRPQRDLLTLGNVVRALLLTLLLVIGLAIYGMSRSADEKRNFKAVDLRLQQMQAQVTIFATQQGARQQDPELQAQLAAAQDRLNKRRAVLSRLNQGGFGGQHGFAGIFRGLAEISLPGVWLTAIDIRGDSQAMALRGRLLNEALLPGYVEQLAAHANFAGRRFSALDIRRVQADQGQAAAASVPYVEFTLNGLSPDSPRVAGGAQ
ncbi:MAG: hypothetical protein PHT48_05750 [Dechloromonas sp.]|nr:hypothetical protein [Dechloromonas sp.]